MENNKVNERKCQKNEVIMHMGKALVPQALHSKWGNKMRAHQQSQHDDSKVGKSALYIAKEDSFSK